MKCLLHNKSGRIQKRKSICEERKPVEKLYFFVSLGIALVDVLMW